MSTSLRMTIPLAVFMQMAEQFANVQEEIIKKNTARPEDSDKK
jgi:hypothetical protein